ncbi:MAG TPA: DUF697 domain-containing protein [Chloroflexota bacterium]|nr:DUF697 domain-containing protein [Chloroflexota bacterium]
MSDMQHFLTDDFRGLDPQSRKQRAAEARQISAIAAGAIAPMPIPFADIWTITPIQILMVRAIANIYGYGLDVTTAKAVLATVGGGWLGRQTFLALLKLGLPGFGEAASAGFAYFWTLGMGRAAEAYLASGMSASRRQMRRAMTELPITPIPPQ